MCTCCHRVCKDLKRLNMKDYDLNYYIVQKCLSPKNRLTHNGIAYICKTCHMNLKGNETKSPRVPRYAVINKVLCTYCHNGYFQTKCKEFNEGRYKNLCGMTFE